MTADGMTTGSGYTSKKKTCVVIDSRDRDASSSQSPTSYTVQLPDVMYDVTSARLLTAEIPTSYYVFSADRGNTSFTLVRNGAPVTVTVPEGNYGLSDMLAALSSELTAACGVSIAVTAPKTTLVCAVTSSVTTDVLGVDTRSVSPSAASTNWGLAYYLGFDRGVLATNTTHIVRSPRVCMMNPELSLYLDIEELGTMVESRTDGHGGTMSRRTFAKIPINADSFQYAYFDKQISCHAYTPPIAVLTKLRLAWRFHTGEPVDFHGVDHSLTIELECATRGT